MKSSFADTTNDTEATDMVKMKLPSKGRYSGIKAVACPIVFGALIITLWQTGALHKILNTTTVILPMPTK